MYCEEDTLDDLMHSVFDKLIALPTNINATKGNNSESIGNLLILKNPLARLSRTETKGKTFSAIGELLWYFSKSNDYEFIKYYLPSYSDYKEKDQLGNEIIFGGYGPRLFDMRGQDQIKNVLDLLKKRPTSRRAVIQIFNAEDIVKHHEDIPCTCTLQFFIRDEKVHMYTSMRSNDAFLGLPHDIFAFTMIQEVIARLLKKELGYYYHAVSSLHIYEKHVVSIKQYLEEGWQGTKHVMPEMPATNPLAAIKEVLKFEADIRKNIVVDITDAILEDYWKDIIRLLQIHTSIKNKKLETVEKISSEIKNKIYITYIKDRIKNGQRR
jgi:thymidylate synthase